MSRLTNYLNAIETDTLDEYYRQRGKYYGLLRCPICGSCKKLYVIKKINEEVIFAQCLRCEFLYNPYDMELITSHNRMKFNRDDLRTTHNTSPNYIVNE